ncbi:MAG: biotin transporter BioY [Pseudomonadota bacterium]
MAIAANDAVITEAVWSAEGDQVWIKRVALVILGVLAIAICAKIKLPIPPSPVPVNLGTLAVLTIGAAYGPRLGFVTIIAYMLVGLLGFNVFANSTAENYGWAYMSGGTGGYLVGYVLATAALGAFARFGWDRNVVLMGVAMFVGNVIIYAFGVAWLYYLVAGGSLPFLSEQFATMWQQTLAWGFWPFLIGDAMKIVLAAVMFPLLWKAIGSART